ncbi:MAG: hypothetical protein ACAH10_06120 [Methylophilaceae bacterium]
MNIHPNKKLYSGLLVALLSSTLLMPAHVMAADKKEAKQTARRIAQIRQQLEAEKAELQTQLQAEKAAIEQKANKTEQESNSLKASLNAAQRNKVSLAAELEKLRQEKSELLAAQQKAEAGQRDTQAALEASQAKLAELESVQRVNDAQRKELSAKLTQRADNLSSCEDKNSKMYDVTLDLIQTCEHPSAFEKVLRSEPFTQIKRVGLENKLEEFRDKADAQKLTTK